MLYLFLIKNIPMQFKGFLRSRIRAIFASKSNARKSDKQDEVSLFKFLDGGNKMDSLFIRLKFEVFSVLLEISTNGAYSFYSNCWLIGASIGVLAFC